MIIRLDTPWRPDLNNDPEFWSGAVRAYIPFSSDLVITQPGVNVSGLLWHHDHPASPGHLGHILPRVIVYDGQRWVVEGTHRVLVRYLGGKDGFTAHVREWVA